MDRIIQSYMDSFLQSQQIEEKDLSKQFEMFASYCSVEQIYADNYNLEDIIIGDGGDCGIDAVAIVVNGTFITSKEEIDDLLEMNRKLSEINFIFVQAKTSANFDYGDMGTFGAGVKDFFELHPQMVRNDAVKEKSEIAEYIFFKSYIYKKETNLLFILCYNREMG